MLMSVKQIRILKEAGRIARLITRKRDGKIKSVNLLAEPDEIATRFTAAPTVVKVLPNTWTHTESLRAGL